MGDPTVSDFRSRFDQLLVNWPRKQSDLVAFKRALGLRVLEILVRKQIHKTRPIDSLGTALATDAGPFKKGIEDLNTLLGTNIEPGFHVFIRCFTNHDGSLKRGRQAYALEALKAAVITAQCLTEIKADPNVDGRLEKFSATGDANEDYPWVSSFLKWSRLSLPLAIQIDCDEEQRDYELLCSSSSILDLASEIEFHLTQTSNRKKIQPYFQQILYILKYHSAGDQWLKEIPARGRYFLCDESLKKLIQNEEFFFSIFPTGQPTAQENELRDLYSNDSISLDFGPLGKYTPQRAFADRSWGLQELVPELPPGENRLWRFSYLRRLEQEQYSVAFPLAFAAPYYGHWTITSALIDEQLEREPYSASVQILYAVIVRKWKVPDELLAKVRDVKSSIRLAAYLALTNLNIEDVSGEIEGMQPDMAMLCAANEVLVSYYADEDGNAGMAAHGAAIANVVEHIIAGMAGVARTGESQRDALSFSVEVERFPSIIEVFLQAYALGAGGLIGRTVESLFQRVLIPSSKSLEKDGKTHEPIAKMVSKAVGDLFRIPYDEWDYPLTVFDEEQGELLLNALAWLGTANSQTVLRMVADKKKNEAPGLSAFAKRETRSVAEWCRLLAPRERMDAVACALHVANRLKRKESPGKRESEVVRRMLAKN